MNLTVEKIVYYYTNVLKLKFDYVGFYDVSISDYFAIINDNGKCGLVTLSESDYDIIISDYDIIISDPYLNINNIIHNKTILRYFNIKEILK